MNTSFLPINNHYSRIDLTTLNKAPILNKKGIEKSRILEIGKYTRTLNESKENIILSKQNLIIEPQKKSSYFEAVDMLSYVRKEIEMKTDIHKYLKTFTTLDIELQKK